MRMAGVVVIDGQPVEVGFKVLLHLVHQLAREAAKIAQLDSVLRGYDETELVFVLGASLQKGRALWMIQKPAVDLSSLSVPAHAVAL